MKFISRHYKKMKIAYIKGAAFAAMIAAFALPHYQKLESTGDNIFIVSLNGEEVGVVGDLDKIDNCLIASVSFTLPRRTVVILSIMTLS